MSTWLEEIYDQLSGAFRGVGQQLSEQGILPLLRPVAPFNEPPILVPIVAVSALLAFCLLTGVAISAFATLVVALLALYLVLAEVFGYSVEFIPLRVG